MPDAAGIYYSVHEEGSLEKPPLVLIHGAGASHQIWPAELRDLPGFRVFALDLPGHGKSAGTGGHSIFIYADCLVKFLDTLHLRKAVFVGHSMGSAIALALALEHRSRVVALGLIGTGAVLDVPGDLLDFSANPATLPIAVESLIQRSFGPRAPAPLIEDTIQCMLETRPGVLNGDLKACTFFDIRKQLDRIRLPIILFCGSEDRLTPPPYAHLLESCISAACLRLYYGAGHMLFLERPQALAADLVEFLNSIPEQVKKKQGRLKTIPS
ncbi:MAG TPA: alpha/beta fold hydrolase [Anaerolineaceae bacterium]|nr:alpha/beta fold hydrolase [Anaerolineaceae bacterium]